jgi:hypothetical protein
MQFVKPTPFTEAIDKIGSKTPIGSQLNSSQWGAVPVQLRERAFFSATVENVRFLQRGRDAITDFLSSARETLPDGRTAIKTGSRSEFVKIMREFALAEGMGPLDPDDVGTIKDITSERRLGLIFDTQTRQAYSYGSWQQGNDPDVLDEFPAQRLVRVQDVKEPRQHHTIFEGVPALKSDLNFWLRINQDFGVPWGPWGWGCGHDVEDVDRAESEALGLIAPGQPVDSPESGFNDHLESSVQGLDNDLLQFLKTSFGDQINITGDSVQWGPQKPSAPEQTEPQTKRAIDVSNALNLRVAGHTKNAVQSSMAAIDSVHSDGKLPKITVAENSSHSYGYFQAYPSKNGWRSSHIGIRGTGAHPELTTAHEVGHFLDLAGIGEQGTFASEIGKSPISNVMKLASETTNITQLKQSLTGLTGDERKHVEYLLKPVEIWARAYAQYVAEKSSSKTMQAQLDESIKNEGLKQWTHDAFKPIKVAIDESFKQMGWIK